MFSRNSNKFIVSRNEYVFWTHVSELLIMMMKISASFCEYVQHDPNFALGVGLIIEASKFDVAHQWILDRFVYHIDHSIGAAVSNLHILMILWQEDEILDGVSGELLVFFTFE